MSLLDSHCHIDRFYHKGILEEVFERAQVSGVDQLVAIGTEQHELSAGRLSDVAPTVLALMGLTIPDSMTGNVLFPRGVFLAESCATRGNSI